MGDVVQLKKKKPVEKHRRSLLYKRNFHQWEIDKERQFDTRQGRLMTLYKCKRCGKTKTEAR
jgi:hypothetical protein